MLLKKVRKTIEKYSMLKKGDRVLVAVSGGPDSIALLNILYELREEYNLKLMVVHLNHGLRGKESDRDEKFVRRMAERLNLKCYSKRIKPGALKENGVSPEESARRARYKYFEQLIQRLHCDRIALGHNADDQAETVLMRFIRGSGLKGLGGIPPVRKKGMIIRPLIESSRKEIEEFLKTRNITYVIDSTNQSKNFLRNRYRHELIPFIEKNLNPRLKKSLVRMAEIFRRDEELINKKIKPRGSFYKKNNEGIVIKLNLFKRLSKGKKLRIIMRVIEDLLGDLRHFGAVHFQDILKISESKKPNQKIYLPRKLTAVRDYKLLKILFNKKRELETKFNVKLKINDRTLIVSLNTCIESRLIFKKDIKRLKMPKNMALLDYDKLEKPLFFRNYCHGDRFIPLGSPGTKKLKDFFIDEKVPLERRYKIPVLVSKDKIVWVAGYRIDDRFKVTDDTEHVLMLKVV